VGTRGATTVEIRAALLHHRSHLPRNHIYHVIGPCTVISVAREPLYISKRDAEFRFISMDIQWERLQPIGAIVGAVYMAPATILHH